MLRLKSHRVQLGGAAGTLGARIEAALSSAQFQPPDLKQLADALKIPANQLPRIRTVLLAMEREGRMVKIATDLYFSRAAADAARVRLVEYLKAHSEITAATFRDLLGASRKFAIALLDHFDHAGVTTRIGDARRLPRLHLKCAGAADICVAIARIAAMSEHSGQQPLSTGDELFG